MSDKARDYTLSAHDARELKGMVLLPCEFRIELLKRYASSHGQDALINLFAQFIGMANSVVDNARESAEMVLILGGMNPYEAEKLNTPSLFGAIQGVELASTVDQRKTCVGCAFRLGSMANQSPITTTDADDCVKGNDRFMCHEDLDCDGAPTRACAGHSQLIRAKDSP
jgi:hypothetical protein